MDTIRHPELLVNEAVPDTPDTHPHIHGGLGPSCRRIHARCGTLRLLQLLFSCFQSREARVRGTVKVYGDGIAVAVPKALCRSSCIHSASIKAPELPMQLIPIPLTVDLLVQLNRGLSRGLELKRFSRKPTSL